MKATIDVWQHVPPQEDEEPGFLTYRLAGLIDVPAGGTKEPYCCEISIEIDGRDGECKHLWGVDIAPEQFFGEEWDAVLSAIEDVPALGKDMADRTATYYNEC